MRADRVLVVDDRESSRYMVARVLRKAGFEVDEAATGEEALRLASSRPALVILDINLPDMSGIEVCRRIKAGKETASVLVVHLSASYVSTEAQAHGLSVGADGYLTHPVDPSVLVATVRAFLRIRRAEDALRRANGELAETISLRNADIAALKVERELRERFVATLTHDLRSPLAAARISAEMLTNPRGDEAFKAKAARRIIQNIDRTDRMIQDLLDANRIRAGQPLPLDLERFDLRALLREVAADFESLYAGRLHLIADGAANGKIEGHWSREGLRRVLENLLNNAFKYGDPSLPVSIEADAREAGVELRVHNHGDPIPPEEQAYLFDPFRRARAASVKGAQGWGLGLTLVRGIAEAHGGQVRVSSSEREGTVFSVGLPWDSRPFEAAEASSAGS